jgi:hypothetical protein
MSFFAYIFKIALTEFKSLAENLAESCIRIIRDCPAEAVGPRKVRNPPYLASPGMPALPDI